MKSGSLSLLTHCEMREDSTGMPTWIPDWTVPHACSRIDNPSACWDSRAQARYLGQSVLAAKGVYVAAVSSLVVLLNDPGRISDVEVDDVFRSLIASEFGSNFLNCSDKVDALCRTLCCNCFAEHTLPPASNFPNLEQCRKYLFKVTQMTNRTVSEGDEEPGYLTEVADTFAGRVLFITHDRHISLALEAVKIEDEV